MPQTSVLGLMNRQKDRWMNGWVDRLITICRPQSGTLFKRLTLYKNSQVNILNDLGWEIGSTDGQTVHKRASTERGPTSIYFLKTVCLFA